MDVGRIRSRDGIFDNLVHEVAIPLHGDVPQPIFEMGLAVGEVISQMSCFS